MVQSILVLIALAASASPALAGLHPGGFQCRSLVAPRAPSLVSVKTGSPRVASYVENLPLVQPSRLMVPPRGRPRADLVKRRFAPILIQDVAGAALVLTASTAWLKIWTYLATAGRVSSKVSRKIVHCGSGPLFLLCWPFFSASSTARFVAAAVPFVQGAYLVVAGLSKKGGDAAKQAQGTTAAVAAESTAMKVSKPTGLVAALSRTGNPLEVLQGPFIYVIVLLIATLVFWRDNLQVGIVAISQMAAGDGMADIVGRKYGAAKWPFNKDKSYAGSIAFVLSGFLVSLGLISWFHFWNLIPFTVASTWLPVLGISLICAAVELVPVADDNVTVPLVASLLSMTLFT